MMGDPPSSLRAPGERVGEYVGERLLGEGAGSQVYLARHHALGGAAALKLLFDGERAARLGEEARLLSRLEHPRIVRLLAAGLDGDPPYVAMEYVPGGSLRDRLAAGPLAAREALRLARELLEALAHAHDAGLVHGDVKPENVLLDAEGGVRLADFGFAVEVAPREGIALSEGFEEEGAAARGGTRAYMAPEQARGEPVGPAADLYAVAVLLFEMLCGRLPEPGDRPSEFVPALPAPARIDALFAGAFCRAERRFPSARAMAGALAEALAEGAPAKGRVGDAMEGFRRRFEEERRTAQARWRRARGEASAAEA